MLTPGKLYRFDSGNTVCTFFTLMFKLGYYKATIPLKTISIHKNDIHYFLGEFKTNYGWPQEDYYEELIFIVNDVVIARDKKDERYMTIC